MEHFVNKSNTAKSEKDLWQTPKEVFNTLNDEFNFQVDIFASDQNHLCDLYFTAERSAFADTFCGKYPNYWLTHDTFFANPPYSLTADCLGLLAERAVQYNVTIVALVNANTDTKWFADCVKSANEIRLISGRVGFIASDGKKSNGNTKGQCLIIWRGKCETPCQITMVSRDQLMK